MSENLESRVVALSFGRQQHFPVDQLQTLINRLKDLGEKVKIWPFLYFTFVSVNYILLKLPVAGFEPESSGIGNEHSHLRSKMAKNTKQSNFKLANYLLTLFIGCGVVVGRWQCDQIWRFIGLWPTFKCIWQHLICPNLSHS